jgi:hypothetical protein
VKHSNTISRYSKAYHLSEITVAFINYGADKGPIHHNVVTCESGGPQQVQDTKISCKFFFRSDSTILTEGSILGDLGVTPPIIIGSLDY